MGLTGLLGKNNLEGLRLHLEAPAELYDDQPGLARLHIRNAKRLFPVFLVELDIEGNRAFIPYVPARTAIDIPFDLQLAGRGRVELTGLSLRSRFPVDFFIRNRRLPFSEQLLLLPAPRPFDPGRMREESADRGEHPRSLPRRSAEGEMMSVGDYSGSEPRKHIHWKASARMDALKVKQFAPGSAAPVMIDPALMPGGDLETRLGQAAWLVNLYGKKGLPMELKLASGERLGAEAGSGRLRLLANLALYDAR